MANRAPVPPVVLAIAMALDRYARGNEPMREIRLDALLAAGEIGIVWRQCPDGVQVLRQDHDASIVKERWCRTIRNAVRNEPT